MNDILSKMARNRRNEVMALYPNDTVLQKMIADCNQLPLTFSMSSSLRNTPGGIIAEFKRRSPSKGDIFPMADAAEVIPAYVNNGAAGCSVLTDTRFFGGSTVDLAIARKLSNNVPLLCKDFIVTPAQIYEARLLGASAILLIAAILTSEEITRYNSLAHSLGMETLVEIHDFIELDKITFTPDMLGVNNRDLFSFHTDITHSLDLASRLPSGILLVAESGIKTPDDMLRLRDAGFTGFLIGEAFMSTYDPGATLKKFIHETI